MHFELPANLTDRPDSARTTGNINIVCPKNFSDHSAVPPHGRRLIAKPDDKGHKNDF